MPSLKSNFFLQARARQSKCESDSWKSLGDDTKLSDLFEDFCGLTILLYEFSICHWGCHGGHHILEYLAGRTVNTVVSAQSLIFRGYYDEAYSLIRAIFETSNLVYLFYVDSKSFESWLTLPEPKRRNAFSPYQVRVKLENLGQVVPIDQEKYAELSQIAVHVTPYTLPGAHNTDMRPIVGSLFQPIGLRRSLLDLLQATCLVSAPISRLSVSQNKKTEELLNTALELINRL